MLNQSSGSGVFYTFGQVRGVIFGNIFDRCNVLLKIMGNDDTKEWSNGHFPQSYGTADNLFFENNTISFSASYNGGDPGWIESGQGGRVVVPLQHLQFCKRKMFGILGHPRLPELAGERANRHNGRRILWEHAFKHFWVSLDTSSGWLGIIF